MARDYTILTDFAENRALLEETASRFGGIVSVEQTVEPEMLHSVKIGSKNVLQDVENALTLGAHVEPTDASNVIVVVGKDKGHLVGVLDGMGYSDLATKVYPDGGHDIVEIKVPRLELEKEVECMRREHRVGRFPLSHSTAG